MRHLTYHQQRQRWMQKLLLSYGKLLLLVGACLNYEVMILLGATSTGERYYLWAHLIAFVIFVVCYFLGGLIQELLIEHPLHISVGVIGIYAVVALCHRYIAGSAAIPAFPSAVWVVVTLLLAFHFRNGGYPAVTLLCLLLSLVMVITYSTDSAAVGMIVAIIGVVSIVMYQRNGCLPKGSVWMFLSVAMLVTLVWAWINPTVLSGHISGVENPSDYMLADLSNAYGLWIVLLVAVLYLGFLYLCWKELKLLALEPKVFCCGILIYFTLKTMTFFLCNMGLGLLGGGSIPFATYNNDLWWDTALLSLLLVTLRDGETNFSFAWKDELERM
ncbi:hypothetical protein RFF05_13265 [Bengtsoniella intestinalis]|uniref:hypothetical protein n=1 Tax=Bengtsoniella intestinalis TaxID=3073143 RepID=UPI00391FCA75